MPPGNESPPVANYIPSQDFFVVKLFVGEEVPAELQGAKLELPGGPSFLVHADPAGWLAMVTVLDASRWLPNGSITAGAQFEPRMVEVFGDEDAVAVEIVPGAIGDGRSTDRLEIDGGSIVLEVIYNGEGKVIGLLVLRASQTLPPLMRPGWLTPPGES